MLERSPSLRDAVRFRPGWQALVIVCIVFALITMVGAVSSFASISPNHSSASHDTAADAVMGQTLWVLPHRYTSTGLRNGSSSEPETPSPDGGKAADLLKITDRVLAHAAGDNHWSVSGPFAAGLSCHTYVSQAPPSLPS